MSCVMTYLSRDSRVLDSCDEVDGLEDGWYFSSLKRCIITSWGGALHISILSACSVEGIFNLKTQDVLASHGWIPRGLLHTSVPFLGMATVADLNLSLLSERFPSVILSLKSGKL